MPFLRSRRANISTTLTLLRRSHCTGVPTWLCSCGQSGAFDCKIPASCSARPAKTKEYARDMSGQFSVPDDLRLFHIRFSRRKLRTFVVPSFLMYVFTKPPPRFSPGGGYVGSYLNEITVLPGVEEKL